MNHKWVGGFFPDPDSAIPVLPPVPDGNATTLAVPSLTTAAISERRAQATAGSRRRRKALIAGWLRYCMSAARRRDAARVIVLDENDRVLLLRYDEGGGVFWATPGGAVDAGEAHNQAALRELKEELGVEDVELGPQIASRAKTHMINGEPTEQVELYFTARVPAGQVDPANATQTDGILAWQWWTLADLDRTHQTVYPLGLTTLIERYLRDGVPTVPAILQG
ncbi:NUDIX domain-containing protein [Sphaerisporangium sp. NPDC051011]|uniref:NUDIX hydrolase n=1 Tax=Sphaerisporangium sp. NPDC051011 TaxID=3155792 RepID=UPI0033E9F16E